MNDFVPYRHVGKYTSAFVTTPNMDQVCTEQLFALLNDSNYTNPIAVMPDTHAGKGAIIGFTMKLGESINPTTVGVDQGCGMLSCRYITQKNISVQDIDYHIRRFIPFGENVHHFSHVDMKKDFPWKKATETARLFTLAYNKEYGTTYNPTVFTYDYFVQKCAEIGMSSSRAELSIGTLGGGNHFIEFGTDGRDDWVTIHSGSRQFGAKLCQYWESVMLGHHPKAEMKRKIDEFLRTIKGTVKNVDIAARLEEFKKTLVPDRSRLLTGDNLFGYLMDLILGQQYASFNREVMLRQILKIVGGTALETIETVHNYIDFSDMIIRKGAIKGYSGERVVIPFNMEDGILICEGKSNSDWNYSLPHGAGRIASRSWANANLDPNEARLSMESKGIFSTIIPADETKGAYKDAEEIETYISPNATIVARIKPTHNLKS
jgi:RNA-splicing ligase RtcB